LRDAIEMEWAGIPAVAIVHEALAGSADAMKKMSRMPDYPYLKVPYPTQPTGIWPDGECAAIVEALVPQIVERLTAKREKVPA
jgi:hypothetical protein